MSSRSPGASALAFGLLCSVPAALPAWLRVASAGHWPMAGAALVASVSLIVVPVGVWLRRSRIPGSGSADVSLLAGAALSALPLALFGGVLKSTTHHRPLGGATFAVAALGLFALCVGLSFRVLRGASGSVGKSPWQKLFILGCGSSLVFALLLGIAKGARPSLLDFLALAAAAAVAGLAPLPRSLAALTWRLALPGWMGLLACATVALQNAQLVRSLTTQAPVSFAALSWLGVGS